MIRIAWSERYCHKLPDNHRFPMEKYNLIRQQLLYEGIALNNNFFKPPIFDHGIITDAHTHPYYNKLLNLNLTKKEQRQTGFPLSKDLIDREIEIAFGTVQCSLFALKYGVSINVAGGTHHAFTDKGEGFCLLNDQMIAANYLIKNKLSSKILIVDLDVHQGNGTAEMARSNDNIITLSLHGAKNYPLRKELSDYDYALIDGTGDKEYLSILSHALKEVSESHVPDFVFYQAGVDVLEGDKLGRLSISLDGCLERDRIVMEYCKTNNYPLVICMGGGYPTYLSHLINAHRNTFSLAFEYFS